MQKGRPARRHRNHKTSNHAIPVDRAAAPDVDPGLRIGPYTLLKTLGQGSMAVVYLARDETGHEVALKVFREGPNISPTLLERFRREAEATKRLRHHPNIITVYATGQEGPYHYIAMTDIRDSRTLEDAVHEHQLSIDALVTIAAKIARALFYAHQRDIIHRDIKPTNIMLDEFGEPVLADFGVAELADWPSCTVTGALTGTPLYMSPEQARGERAGPTSDVYSLAVVLYEALTGVLPYPTQHYAPVKQVLHAIQHEPPRNPRRFCPALSPDLEAVLLKALSPRPEDRYANAEAFAEDLERTTRGEPVTAPRYSRLAALSQGARRYAAPLGAVAAGLIVAAGVAGYFRHRLLQERFNALFQQAQLRNLEWIMAQADEPQAPAGRTTSAWNGIRQARRLAAAGQLDRAAEVLRNAAAGSRADSDARTASIADLELARCDILRMRWEPALGVYYRLIASPETPATVAALAQIDAVGLASIQHQPERIDRLLALREPPERGPFGDAIACLIGRLPIDALLEDVPIAPRRFRNDLLLAVAIRQYRDGEDERARITLVSCVSTSTPSSEWPAHFARLLHGRFRMPATEATE